MNTLEKLKKDIKTIENSNFNTGVYSDKNSWLAGCSKKEVEEYKKCFRKIVYLCNYKERAQEELREKLLIKYCFDKETINKCLCRALKLGIVDDQRYAEYFINTSLSSLKGTYYIKKHLEHYKIDYKNNDNICRIFENSYSIDLRNALKYLTKHPANSNNPLRNCIRKLVARGYSYEIATIASREYINKNFQ